jgi:hypothetical protein
MGNPLLQPRIDVMCSGSPREMGLAQGQVLRQSIRALGHALADLEAFRLRQPRFVPYPLFRYLAECKASHALGGLLRRHAPEMAERLAGIALGAGLPVRALALIHLLEPELSNVADCTVVPSPGCSALALRGSRSASGEPILAHNFDYLPQVQPFYVLRDSRPAGRLRSLDFTVSPVCGTVSGINERGLCASTNYAFVTDRGGCGIPITMRVAEVLQSCGTVAEAVQWLSSKPRWGGGLIMLADAGGDIASLELSNTRSHVRRPEGSEDMLFHSNQFSLADMREVEISHDAVFGAKAPRALQGVSVLGPFEVRDRRAMELLRSAAALGPDEIAALMADHGPAGEPSFESICVHTDYWCTTACLQLFPRWRRMRVAYATACRAEYREFGL